MCAVLRIQKRTASTGELQVDWRQQLWVNEPCRLQDDDRLHQKAVCLFNSLPATVEHASERPGRGRGLMEQ